MPHDLRPVVTRKHDEDRHTGQSGGAVRISGVSRQHTPATRIWFGKVMNEPGFRSPASPFTARRRPGVTS